MGIVHTICIQSDVAPGGKRWALHGPGMGLLRQQELPPPRLLPIPVGIIGTTPLIFLAKTFIGGTLGNFLAIVVSGSQNDCQSIVNVYLDRRFFLSAIQAKT